MVSVVPLAVAALTFLGPVRVFDLGHSTQAFAVSPDGGHFAVARHGNWIDVHDARNGTVRQSVRFSDGDKVRAIAFSPDGRRLAAGAEHNEELRVWDVATGDQLLGVPAFTGGLLTVAYSPDGKTVAAAGDWDVNQFPDRFDCAHLFDAATGARRGTLHSKIPPPGTTGSDDLFMDRFGAFLGSKTGPDHSPRRAVAFHPSGRFVAGTVGPTGVGHLWHADGGQPVGSFDHPWQDDWCGVLVFSPDGRSFLVGRYDRFRLHETAGGGKRMTGPGGAAAAFGPDGRLLATADDAGGVRIWDYRSGHLRALCVGHTGRVVASLGVGGGWLFVAGEDGTVRVWNWPKSRPETRAAGRLSAGDRERLRNQLASSDARAAYEAMRALSADPSAAVTAARGALTRASPSLFRDEVPRRIAELAAEDFRTREAATRRLRELAPANGPALRHALREATDPEVAWRLARVLSDLAPGRHDLTATEARCLELLEWVNSPDARAVVKAVAAGDPDAPLTRDAADTLARMERAARDRR